MKFGESIVETTRGDRKLREELKQLKANLKARDIKTKELENSISKLRTLEYDINKYRTRLNNSNQALIREKDSHSKHVREMVLKR